MNSNSKIININQSTIQESIHTKNINIEELSLEQKIAYDKFILGNNVFISGPGGTGKTKLIKYFVEYLTSINKKFQVCAMTGCAANLLNCNARTLHSWSGIRLAKGSKNEIIDSVLNNYKSINNWKQIKCLIIDEVSMLSVKIFIIIEELARIIRKINLPFGGLQVIFTGDFYQLPPVCNNNDKESQQFCFETPIWNNVFTIDNHIILKKIFRQNDPVYINILQQIRVGKLDSENIKILKKYVKRDLSTCEIIPTKLFSLRSKTDLVNSQMFSKIDEPIYSYDMITDINYSDPHNLTINYKKTSLSPKAIDYEINQLKNSISCKQVLQLKKNALVMCTINLDLPNGICNGAQGIIIGFTNSTPSFPVVKFNNGIIKTISTHYWVSEVSSSIAIGQLPLTLAWAITIHKIQGATLKNAEIDIGRTIFEAGQTYVALSRIQSLDGLYLSAFDPSKIITNSIVNNFYDNISTSDLTEYHFSSSTVFNQNKNSNIDNSNDNKLIKIIKL